MALLLSHRPVNIESAFASLDISEDSGLSTRNAEQVLRPPPELPTLSTFHPKLVKRLFEGEAGNADSLSEKIDLPMTSLRQGWEWGFRKYNFPFSGTRGFFIQGIPLPDDQPHPNWCTPDPPAVPYFTPRVTRFSYLQQTQFWDKPPPAVDSFGHQERPVQPGPLKTIYLAICAFFGMLMTSIGNGAKLAPFLAWQLFWSTFMWLIVVPVLALSRIIIALRLELIASVALAGWLVRKIPDFGEPLLLGGGPGEYGEIETPMWTIYLKNSFAIGRNGAVIPE